MREIFEANLENTMLGTTHFYTPGDNGIAEDPTEHAEEHEDVEHAHEEIAAEITKVQESTHENTDDTIVKRSHDDGTHIANLVVDSMTPWVNDESYLPGLNFSQATTQGDVNLIDEGRINFYPYLAVANGDRVAVPGAVYRFGKAEAPTEDGDGDGIRMVRPYQGKNHIIELCTSHDTPNLRITAQKMDDVPFMECRDADGAVVWGVTREGHTFSDHHGQDDLSKIPDHIAHSYISEGRSVYLGQMRISWNGMRERVEYLHQIPGYLVNLGVVTANLIRPANQYTIRQWLILARQTASNNALKTSDVFPAQYDGDWVSAGLDYCHDLTSSVQAQLSAVSTDIDSNETDIAALESIFQSNLDAYSAANGSNNVLLSNVHTMVSGNEANISTLQTNLTTEGGRIDALETSTTNLGTRVTTLESLPAAPTTVVQMADVSSAGSGLIITAAERTLLSTHETEITALQNAGSGGLTGNDVSTSSGNKTLLELENTGNGHVEFVLADLDHAGNNDDHRYRFQTQNSTLDMFAAFYQHHQTNATETKAFTVSQNGNICFFGSGANTSFNAGAQNFQVRGSARFFGDVLFDNPLTVHNNFNVGDANTSYKIFVNGSELDTGGGAKGFFATGHNQTHDLTTERSIFWTRDAANNTAGGTVTFNLPPTSYMTDGETLTFHFFQTLDEWSDWATCTLLHENDQSFNPHVYDDSENIVYSGNQWNKLYLNKVNRKTFTATFDATNKTWFIKVVSDTRAQHFQQYIKTFTKTDANYTTTGAPFDLPRGYRNYRIVVGDGSVSDANSTEKWFNLPANAELGDKIEFFYLYPSAMHGSKSFVKTNGSETIIQLASPGGIIGNNSFHTISQASYGRKVSSFLNTGTNQWTLHRTM
jgi:hypothetical protein